MDDALGETELAAKGYRTPSWSLAEVQQEGVSALTRSRQRPRVSRGKSMHDALGRYPVCSEVQGNVHSGGGKVA